MSDGMGLLVSLVAQLRSEQGCPWDRAQTWKSMRPYLLEETYEVLEAMDHDDSLEMERELGDLLFQVVLLAQIAADNQQFTLDDVANRVHKKMVSRHPHVFDPNHGSVKEFTITQWEAQKAKERSPQTSALDGVPRALPALLRAHRVGEKASAVGFDWNCAEEVKGKVLEEWRELQQAQTKAEQEEEYGDLLLSLVSYGRHLGLCPESALRAATSKFEGRFHKLESQVREQHSSVGELDASALNHIWDEVKSN